MSLTLPSDAGELLPEERLVILDNVQPRCAIDARSHVYWLHFALIRDDKGEIIQGSAAMRVIHYPPGSLHGTEVRLSFNPNASGIFVEVGDRLQIVGHHNTYPSGKKRTHVVYVAVPDAVGPMKRMF